MGWEASSRLVLAARAAGARAAVVGAGLAVAAWEETSVSCTFLCLSPMAGTTGRRWWERWDGVGKWHVRGVGEEGRRHAYQGFMLMVGLGVGLL
ncbi:hypothetical protein IWX50DRAFT_624595 [Phyllosticta citricarpa]